MYGDGRYFGCVGGSGILHIQNPEIKILQNNGVILRFEYPLFARHRETEQISTYCTYSKHHTYTMDRAGVSPPLCVSFSFHCRIE